MVRDGDPVTEIIRLAGQTGAERIFIADDVSRYAARRRAGLQRGCAAQRRGLTVTPGLAVVPPGDLHPAGGDHYRVFTPYWRAWLAAPWRKQAPVPRSVTLPGGLRPGRIVLDGCARAAAVTRGGESAGKERARRWLDGELSGYPGRHDDLAGDRTSRLPAGQRRALGYPAPILDLD